MTGEQVHDTIISWAARGIGLVLVDYIQLMEGASDSRQEVVGYNVRRLKAAARDAGIPVLALSQFSRGPMTREDTRPRLSDLRDSGQIEQVGDTIVAIYATDRTQTGEVRPMMLAVLKQRQGPVGDVPVVFDGPRTMFMGADHARP